MVKIALVTDTHAGIRNDNLAFHAYQKRCWNWFFEYIDSHDIKHVIHLGDIYDKRKTVNFLTSRRLREDFLEQLYCRGIETHIVQGNHDSYHRNTHEVNALEELVAGRYANIHTYSVPTIINVDGIDIQLMPWITDSNRKQSLECIKNPKASILMGHLELSGFQMFKGSISEHGMDRNEFEKFDAVYSGHYHHKSTIGNVSYIGAFGEYTWSDHNDPRGFSVFDTRSRKINFIVNPNRMFRTIEYNDIDDNVFDYIKNHSFQEYKDCYVKIIVINKTNSTTFDLFFDTLYKAGPLDITIIEDASVLLEDEDVEVNEAEDTRTILNKYIDGLTLSIDSKRMKKFMTDVYQEALQFENV